MLDLKYQKRSFGLHLLWLVDVLLHSVFIMIYTHRTSVLKQENIEEERQKTKCILYSRKITK